jgi:hypothetical protein
MSAFVPLVGVKRTFDQNDRTVSTYEYESTPLAPIGDPDHLPVRQGDRASSSQSPFGTPELSCA